MESESTTRLTREAARTGVVQYAFPRWELRAKVGETAYSALELGALFLRAFDASTVVDEVLQLDSMTAVRVLISCAQNFQPGGGRPAESSYARDARIHAEAAEHLGHAARYIEDHDQNLTTINRRAPADGRARADHGRLRGTLARGGEE